MNDTALNKTSLFNLHLEHNAKMVPFAGYDMPIQYSLGIKKEHLHTRKHAGLFDVSHMGQLLIKGKNAAQWLESLMPTDIVDLPIGKQRYSLLTNNDGGVIDDLIVSRFDHDTFYLVVNASRKTEDLSQLHQHLHDNITLKQLEDRALIALQGPESAKVLEVLIPKIKSMIFMDCIQVPYLNSELYISRSGYTGEDGFEISIKTNLTEAFCQTILQNHKVKLIGLGARNSLRLESGLCLYGHELNETTTPIESNLMWAISKVRRADGMRAGGFTGHKIILDQIKNNNIKRKRVGLISKQRTPIREGTPLLDSAQNIIGEITSGTFSPSMNQPIAMAYIDKQYSALNTEVYAHVRNKILPVIVTKMPFISQRYHRG